MDNRQIETFDIAIPREMTCRLLGMRPGARPPRETTLLLLERGLAMAADLVDARAVMRFSHAGLPGSTHLPTASPLVAVVCTIGPALEERASALAAGGETALAAILDAAGSAAAEETADASNRLICELAAPTDMVPRARRSPGYGDWDLEEQRALFRYLEPAEIGVTLTERCMMVPRKSISYVVRLDATREQVADEAGRERCSGCAALECRYRGGAAERPSPTGNGGARP